MSTKRSGVYVHEVIRYVNFHETIVAMYNVSWYIKHLFRTKVEKMIINYM